MREFEARSDDDPNMVLRIMEDDQGDVWLSLSAPSAPWISFRACTSQGGGKNLELRKALSQFLNPTPPQADTPIKGAGEAVIVRVIKEDLGWKGTCTRIGEEYACVPDKPPTVEGWHVIGTVLHIAKDCGEVIPFFTKNPATLQREYAALTATPAPIEAEVREALQCLSDLEQSTQAGKLYPAAFETIRAALKKGG